MIPGKQLLWTALLFTSLQAVHAQDVLKKEGRVVYERKVNVHRRLADESMKSMVPEFSTSKVELLFSSDESLGRNIKEEEDIRDQAGQETNGPVVRMKFGGGDDQTYKNYSTEKMIQQREMGPKKYIIEDSFPHQSWKLAADTQLIKGYLCKKATTLGQQGNTVIAWYTEDIQSPSGPEVYGGLPGLILQLNINDGEMVYSAQEITTGNSTLVHAPTDGKKITRAAFRKMMEEQFGPDAGSGRPTIRIIRN
jgi:GLPGLI family protein